MSRKLDVLKQLEIEVDQVDRISSKAKVLTQTQIEPVDVIRLFGAETVHLVQTVFVSNGPRSARRVVFCGADAETGSTSLCADAARALATITDKAVCIVDADVRLQGLSSMLGVDCAIPSSNPISVRDRCVQLDDNLWLADAALLVNPSGSLLYASELRHRFKQLADQFDYVLVDAPAVGVGTDAALFVETVGAAILVIEANSTRRHTALRAKESLEATGARLLGTVLRNRTFPIPESLYKRI
jgi:protein-tyrosine kinase